MTTILDTIARSIVNALGYDFHLYRSGVAPLTFDTVNHGARGREVWGLGLYLTMNRLTP